MYLKDAIREFIYELQIRNYSSRAVKDYNNDLKRFSNFMKEKYDIDNLKDVSTVHIKQYLGNKKAIGVKSVTLNTYLKRIRVFFNYCYQEEYCLNVAKKIRRAKEPNSKTSMLNSLLVLLLIHI